MSYNIRPLTPETIGNTIWKFTMPYSFFPYVYLWDKQRVWLYIGAGEHQEMASATTFEQADAIVQALWRSAVTNWLDANLLPAPRPNPPLATWD